MSTPTYKIVVSYDSNDRGYVPTASLTMSVPDEGEIPVEAEVEVRDYGRGSTPDESGALYERRED